MKYVSTRGQAPVLGFCDAVLTGLARDGGLYVPEIWPQLDHETIRSFANKSYVETAKTVLAPYIDGEIEPDVFGAMVEDAYGTFHHNATAPLVQIDDSHFILELFHGPTLAFKDVAMQLLARLMDHILSQNNSRATIIGATSGDTGGAAIEAFRGRKNVDIFILFPHGKVSPVQQRQMTTVHDSNVHAIAIDGNFDDCQSLVKDMFAHFSFRDKVKLAGVNSINWARIMAQIVYYFTSASSLGAPEREVSFCVPTGNFGDIFAGFVAKQMGLPIGELIIATNQNDILARTLKQGRYEISGVSASTSPSMDIQVSSNFERLLFESENRDGEAVVQYMSSLRQSGAFTLSERSIQYIKNRFSTGSSNDKETATEILSTLKNSNYIADPHTGVGIKVANEHINSCDTQMITLATAHPAKFPDAVKNACGIDARLPDWIGDLNEREEKFDRLPNELEAVESFIEKHTGF